MAVFGVTTPSAQADVSDLDYNCTLTVLDATPSFDMSVSVTGSPTQGAHVGDQVSLNDFQLIGQVSDAPVAGALAGISTGPMSGAADFSVDGGFEVGSPQNVPLNIDMSSTPPTTGGFTLTTPASPIEVSGFTADQAGTMSFTAGDSLSATLSAQTVSGVQQFPLSCSRSSGVSESVIATTEVAAPTTPPTTPPSTSPTPHTPPAHSAAPSPGAGSPSSTTTASAQEGLSNLSPNDSPSAGGSDPTGTGPGSTSSATLPSTGTSNALPLTVGGAALVLVGAGLLYVARRRGTSPELDT
jgi:LPXTG-motif cell wall-anchored protein